MGISLNKRAPVDGLDKVVGASTALTVGDISRVWCVAFKIGICVATSPMSRCVFPTTDVASVAFVSVLFAIDVAMLSSGEKEYLKVEGILSKGLARLCGSGGGVVVWVFAAKFEVLVIIVEDDFLVLEFLLLWYLYEFVFADLGHSTKRKIQEQVHANQTKELKKNSKE